MMALELMPSNEPKEREIWSLAGAQEIPAG